MNPSDTHDDPIMDALRELHRWDVSAVRARRLRERCHRSLAAQQPLTRGRQDRATTLSRRTLRVAVGAWCCVYLFETLRRAAAFYWF
jgi:hypothetical protein